MAAWRLNNLFAFESGPYKIFEKFRTLIRVVELEDPEDENANEQSRLFACFYCLSVSACILVFGTHALIPWSIYVFTPLALSTGVILIYKATD